MNKKMQRYNVNFYHESIETTVTSDPSVVEYWIKTSKYIHRRRLNKLVVGLDIEWRPNSPDDHLENPVALIQLCVGHRCLIFQLLCAKVVPLGLYMFLSNPKYTFVGVGIKEDLQKLMSDYGLFVKNAVDVRKLAAFKICDGRLLGYGLQRLGTIFLGKTLPKPKNVTLSQWDSRTLSYPQIEYACLDAFVSFELGRVLQASVN